VGRHLPEIKAVIDFRARLPDQEKQINVIGIEAIEIYGIPEHNIEGAGFP
jgi:hypothetical protein